MTFEVLIEEGDIKKITIYEEGQKKPLQTITEVDPEADCEPLGMFSYFDEDINFDGYNDFKFTCWRGATGNEGFRYLIYNKVKKKFYFSRQFVYFTGINADQKRKVITSFRNQGFAGRIYVADTYKWIKGKLILIEEERQAPSENDPNKFLKVKKKRIKGKMTVVEQETLDIDNL